MKQQAKKVNRAKQKTKNRLHEQLAEQEQLEVTHM